MATRLFLHAAANTLTGTFPTTEQSVTFSARYTAGGGGTLRTMDSLTGVSQTTLAASLSASGTYQVFFGHFCSPTLASDQTIGAGAQTITLNLGLDTSLTSTSATAVATNLYVWRPSTGAKVGTVYDGTMNPIDIASGTTQRTWNATISAAASVAALAGDVIIVECWRLVKPTAGTARSVRMYYDGTVLSTTQSATSSNHAAFLDFATDTITFSQPPVSGSFAQTLAAVTLQGAGSSPRNATFDNTLGAVALAGVSAVLLAGTYSNTLGSVSLSASGINNPVLGTFNKTLDAATATGSAAVLLAGVRSGTLGAVTLGATGGIPVTGASDKVLDAATLVAQGTGEEVIVSVGALNAGLDAGTLAALGTVADTPTAAPTERQGTAPDIGQRKRKRKKFVIPEDVPGWSLDRVFGVEPREPDTPAAPEAVPMAAFPLAEALTQVVRTPQEPAKAPAKMVEVEPEDEPSDEDLMVLLMLAI